MFSLIVGFGLVFWVSRVKVGLAMVLLYGVVAGVISANASYRDAAGLLPVSLALVGFGLARLLISTRYAWKVSSENIRAKMQKRGGRKTSTSVSPQPPFEIADGDREDLYIAAGLAHATFLNALGRELDDVEFVAASLGAFDGAVQALGRELSHVEMLAMGSTFALRQINDLQRMQDTSSAARGDMIGKAMTSKSLKEVRAQSGQLAFTITKNSPLTGSMIP